MKHSSNGTGNIVFVVLVEMVIAEIAVAEIYSGNSGGSRADDVS